MAFCGFIWILVIPLTILFAISTTNTARTFAPRTIFTNLTIIASYIRSFTKRLFVLFFVIRFFWWILQFSMSFFLCDPRNNQFPKYILTPKWNEIAIHFIHLIARQCNFSHTNVAVIALAVLMVSFSNHFHRKMAILDCLDIRMLCAGYFHDLTVHHCWPSGWKICFFLFKPNAQFTKKKKKRKINLRKIPHKWDHHLCQRPMDINRQPSIRATYNLVDTIPMLKRQQTNRVMALLSIQMIQDDFRNQHEILQTFFPLYSDALGHALW